MNVMLCDLLSERPPNEIRRLLLTETFMTVVPGWVYYHISSVMQYSNEALETTTIVMYDPDTFFFVVPLTLMDLRIS